MCINFGGKNARKSSMYQKNFHKNDILVRSYVRRIFQLMQLFTRRGLNRVTVQ